MAGFGSVTRQNLCQAAPLIGLVFTVPPARLSIGRYDLRVALGGNVLSTTPFLVSFSDRWVLSNLEDVISLINKQDKSE